MPSSKAITASTMILRLIRVSISVHRQETYPTLTLRPDECIERLIIDAMDIIGSAKLSLFRYPQKFQATLEKAGSSLWLEEALQCLQFQQNEYF